MKIFFPGAIPQKKSFKTNQCRSLWREREFLYTIVLQAILPSISLREVVVNWIRIRETLKEPPRKRKLQIDTVKNDLRASG